MTSISRRDALAGGLSFALAGGSRPSPGFGAPGVAPIELIVGPGPNNSDRAYNGASPGPILRARRADALTVKLVNRSKLETTLSPIGLRFSNAQAGVAGLGGEAVKAGETKDLALVPPDAGFGLYLSALGASAPADGVRPLFGAIIVDEVEPPAADLEAVALLSDPLLAPADTKASASASDNIGSGATSFLVNGLPSPARLKAQPGARVRLRIAQVCGSENSLIGADGQPAAIAVTGAVPWIIAVDSQPSELFRPLRDQFPLAPLARFELMFDMPATPGDRVEVDRLLGVAAGAPPERRSVAQFVVDGAPVALRPPISALPANPSLPDEIALERALRVDIEITQGKTKPFALNGASFAGYAEKPLFKAARGTPITLGVSNKTGATQALRLFGHVGRQLHGLDDGWDPYWRDILLVASGKTAHLAFIADNPGKWPIESAIPAHRDNGVGAWFEVG